MSQMLSLAGSQVMRQMGSGGYLPGYPAAPIKLDDRGRGGLQGPDPADAKALLMQLHQKYQSTMMDPNLSGEQKRAIRMQLEPQIRDLHTAIGGSTYTSPEASIAAHRSAAQALGVAAPTDYDEKQAAQRALQNQQDAQAAIGRVRTRLMEDRAATGYAEAAPARAREDEQVARERMLADEQAGIYRAKGEANTAKVYGDLGYVTGKATREAQSGDADVAMKLLGVGAAKRADAGDAAIDPIIQKGREARAKLDTAVAGRQLATENLKTNLLDDPEYKQLYHKAEREGTLGELQNRLSGAQVKNAENQLAVQTANDQLVTAHRQIPDYLHTPYVNLEASFKKLAPNGATPIHREQVEGFARQADQLIQQAQTLKDPQQQAAVREQIAAMLASGDVPYDDQGYPIALDLFGNQAGDQTQRIVKASQDPELNAKRAAAIVKLRRFAAGASDAPVAYRPDDPYLGAKGPGRGAPRESFGRY